MTLDFKKGTLTAPLAGVPPFDVAYTGIGFQPKAVIFFWTRQTIVGALDNESLGLGFGADVNEAFSFEIESDDNEAASNTTHNLDDTACIKIRADATGVFVLDGDLKSLDPDGFSITWNAINGTPYIIHFIALGGADLTNAKAGPLTLNTVSGDQAISGVGFQPDFVLLATCRRTIWANGSMAIISLGAATSPSNRWTVAHFGQDGVGTSNTRTFMSNSKVLHIFTTAGGEDGQADFVSFDPDGFTINMAVGDEFNAAYVVGFLALKGGQYDVDTFAKNTGGAPVDQAITGVGFQPTGLMLSSVGSPTLDVNTDEAELDIGGGDEVDMGAIWGGDEDNQATTNCSVRTVTNKILTNGSVVDASEQTGAIISSLDADGFTITLNPNSGIANQIGYIAFGNEVVPPTPVSEPFPEYGQVRTAVGDPSVFGATILRS